MARPFSRLALAAVIALVLVACSSGSSSKSSAPKPRVKAADPQSTATTVVGAATAVCKLIDVHGVDAFVKGTSTVYYSDVRKCVRKLGKTVLTVSVFKDQTAAMYDEYKKSRTDSEPIAKVGDAADYSEHDQMLQFLKGNKVVTEELAGDSANASAVKPFLVEQAKYAAARS